MTKTRHLKIKEKKRQKTLHTYLRKLKKIRTKFFLRKTSKTDQLSPALRTKSQIQPRSSVQPKTVKKEKTRVQNLKLKQALQHVRKVSRKSAIQSTRLLNPHSFMKKVLLKLQRKHRRHSRFLAKSVRKLKVRKMQWKLAVYKTWAALSKKKTKTFLNTFRPKFYSWFRWTLGERERNSLAEHFPQSFNRKLKRKYLKIKKLRLKLFSQLPKSFFFKPNKWSKPLAKTKKQFWLEKAYQKTYFNINPALSISKRHKFRQDFLQTLLGKYFLLAHLTSLTHNGQRYLSNQTFFRNIPAWLHTLSDQTKKIQIAQKLGWFYTNLTRIKKVRREILLATPKTYPYKIFSTFWTTHKKNPWLDLLKTSRRLYTGLLAQQRREQKWTRKYAWIPYLRKKPPTRQKRNQLYRWRQSLLFSFWNRGLIRKEKGARIKKVLNKTILPFYGHLSEKQFASIKKKVQRKKTAMVSRDDLLLGRFEQRLDVVVYRLNLAPNIFWARQLIQDGAVFLSSTANNQLWEKMYAPFKKFLYPLKLRDPMNLYKKTLWTPFEKTATMKFLIEPLRKIDYLVQPGEIIQCAPGALLNQFKTHRLLWKKPVPKHFLTFSELTETQKYWQYRQNKISARATSENQHTILATLLFPPSHQNFLKSDRVHREFLHWMTH